VRGLVVGLDALAVLAERTGAGEPALAAAATLAELAGAAAVRVGVNEELRPVGEAALRDLRRAARGLELRMAPVPTLVKVALEARPSRVVLSSESRNGTGCAGPLNLRAWRSGLAPSVRTLGEAGLAVVVRVAPDLEAVKAVRAADVGSVELYTGAIVDLPEAERARALDRLAEAARLAAKLRMRVALGGGLDLESVSELVAAVPVAERVAVGRAWAWRSALVGVDRATRDLTARLR
jgi:pyridoxine 5-phosphate synthase